MTEHVGVRVARAAQNGAVVLNGHHPLTRCATVDVVRATLPRAVAVLVAGWAILAAPPSASAEGLTDWTIVSTFIGGRGEDIPLRVGSHDVPGRDGFGMRHIVDGHGAVPDYPDIEAAVSRIGSECQYTPPPDDKWRCSLRLGNRSIFVVFTERESNLSGDGRPVVIVTAYYSPRGCPC